MMYACEIYIAMNEDGGWIVTNNESTAVQELTEYEGGNHVRVVKVTVRMNAPEMTEEDVDVPDEAGSKVEIAAQ